MFLFATIKNLKFIIIHMKIDTIQYINIEAKKKIGRHCSCFQYKTRFMTKPVGRDDEGS